MKSEALWLSVSPHLARFDQRLLLGLSRTYRVAWWEYSQSPDQPCCFDTAIVLLHDFLKAKDRYDVQNIMTAPEDMKCKKYDMISII